ncbi:isochorismatase family protein [Peredibacter sp. HCB2-198]|uniref:isochorismatase family protein n=1 Tax=Peredibacter sp. HCB2-198 TaxID=3383025 RepID=UPI0038B647A1
MKKTSLWDSSQVALILIDYQEEMFAKIRSSDPNEVDLNVKLLLKGASALNIPTILSTVGVQMGVNQATRKSIRDLVPKLTEIDRSSMNAWEDENFRAAVKATGKKHLIFCALWTEICLAFPVVDALNDDYQIMIPVDAVGGLSHVSHNTAIERMVQAGAIPNTSLALITEFFRDWKDQRASVMRPLIVQHFKDEKQLLVRSTSGEAQVYN